MNPSQYRTIFTVRATYEAVRVDASIQYPVLDPGWEKTVNEAIHCELVAARLENRTHSDQFFQVRYPDAWRAAGLLQSLKLRLRFNNDIYGPFNVLTDTKPTDEELIAWFKTATEKEKQDATC